MILKFIAAVALPFLGTMAGSAFVFFVKEKINPSFERCLIGFAAGVMVAASVWSLLIPAQEFSVGNSLLPSLVGLLLGFAFLYLVDVLTPHLHANATKSEGPAIRLSNTWKLALAVTIHNLPEGMAVGAVMAAAFDDPASTSAYMSSAIAVALGIALQNVPEGAIVAMPLRTNGNSRARSFFIGTLSGIVEPVGTLLMLWLATAMKPALPYFLSFAAGTMLYVVVEELIPEGSQGDHSNLLTVGFAVGFAMMMCLDIALG